jgi:hypothetical protein
VADRLVAGRPEEGGELNGWPCCCSGVEVIALPDKRLAAGSGREPFGLAIRLDRRSVRYSAGIVTISLWRRGGE